MAKRVHRHVHCIVPNPELSAVLLLPTQNGWMLPVNEYRLRSRVTDERMVCDDVLRALSLHQPPIPILSFLYRAYITNYRKTETELKSDEVWVMETRHPIKFPGDVRWVSKKELEDNNIELCSELNCTREVLIKYFEYQLQSKLPDRRPPWRKHGWFAWVLGWVKGVLCDHFNDAKVSSVLPIWNKAMAQILKFETLSHGAFYLKATHPGVEEPQITKVLSNLFPRRIPQVLASESNRNVMLMGDFTATHRELCAVQPDMFVTVFQSYGKMQLEAMELLKHSEVSAAIPKSMMWPPSALADRIGDVLEHSEVQAQLSKAELEEFQEKLPMWVSTCTSLENAGVPCTIVHRDLYVRNFAKPLLEGGECLFFDWTLGCVTHPFIGLHQLRDKVGKKSLTEADVDLYLAMWRDYEPDMSKLRRMEAMAAMVRHILGAVGVLELSKFCEVTEQRRYMTIERINWQGCFLNAARSLRALATLKEPIYANE